MYPMMMLISVCRMLYCILCSLFVGYHHFLLVHNNSHLGRRALGECFLFVSLLDCYLRPRSSNIMIKYHFYVTRLNRSVIFLLDMSKEKPHKKPIEFKTQSWMD